MLRAMNVLDVDAMRASAGDGGYCPYLILSVLIRISRCTNLCGATFDPKDIVRVNISRKFNRRVFILLEHYWAVNPRYSKRPASAFVPVGLVNSDCARQPRGVQFP